MSQNAFGYVIRDRALIGSANDTLVDRRFLFTAVVQSKRHGISGLAFAAICNVSGFDEEIERALIRSVSI